MSVAGKNNQQFSIQTIIVFLLVLTLSSGLVADPLNVNLTVSEPEEEYFEPGGDLTVTLNITNDNDQFLRVDQFRDNGLFHVMLWVSGPRQNFLIVQPYLNLRILNENQGYNAMDDFNPINGEMTIYLPDDLEPGTYTILFHVRRRAGNRTYILYPYIDFQVGQVEQTFTQSLSYLTCNRPECHDGVSLHGTADTTNCAICHAYDYEVLGLNLEAPAPKGRVITTGEYGGLSGFRHVYENLGINFKNDRVARKILDLVQYANLHNQKPLTDDELKFIAQYPKVISKLFKDSSGIR